MSRKASVKSIASGDKWTPLHVAGKYGSAGVWKLILESNMTDTLLSMKDAYQRTPEEVAALYGWGCNNGNNRELISSAGSGGRKNTTAILSHPECRQHYTCACNALDDDDAPPENIKRLEVLLCDQAGCLRSEDLPGSKDLLWIEECRRAAISDVLRVHEWSYVSRIENVCSSIAPPLDGVSEEDYSNMRGAIMHLDGDTALSRLSYSAALRAAGSVCQAVDLVLNGEVNNAFCAVRPPGHHAGPLGVVNGPNGGPDSHGFCLLNNVSIGAAYAMNVHRTQVKRVAMVDFDVHHGNGTEETVRWLLPGVEKTDLLGSSVFGTLHTPRYKPWLSDEDAENVLFVSVHGYGPRERGMEAYMPQAAFYPGTGATHIPSMEKIVLGITTTSGDNMEMAEETEKTASAKGENDSDDDEVEGNGSPAEGGDDAKDGSDNGDGDGDDDDDDSDYGGEVDSVSSASKQGSVQSTKSTTGCSNKVAKLLQGHANAKQRRTIVSSSDVTVEPLILDMGVGLPTEEAEIGGEYRHQWRNYFRLTEIIHVFIIVC